MQGRAIAYSIVACSLGRLLVAATERGLCHVRFGDDDAGLERALAEEFPFAALRRDEAALRAWSDTLLRCVEDGAAGVELVDFARLRLAERPAASLPLDIGGSRFQRRVWSALAQIPRGRTRCYSELAASVGVPRGARAVARACAANPLAVIVPCHRVLPKGGGVGGYRWGAARKRALLEREGALPAEPAREASPSGAQRPSRSNATYSATVENPMRA